METQRSGWAGSVGLLILRLGIGGYMVTHGWGKLQMVLAGEFSKFGDPIGLGSALSLVLVTMAEFVCAILIIVGLGTRFAAAPLVFNMGVAAFVAHANAPWTMSPNGPSKEPALLFLIPFLALLFTGAGGLSLDRLIGSRLRARRAQR